MTWEMEMKYREALAAEKAAEEAKKRGVEEGIEEGIEKGIEKGQSLLVDTIRRIKGGASKEELRRDGVDDRTIESAFAVL